MLCPRLEPPLIAFRWRRFFLQTHHVSTVPKQGAILWAESHRIFFYRFFLLFLFFLRATLNVAFRRRPRRSQHTASAASQAASVSLEPLLKIQEAMLEPSVMPRLVRIVLKKRAFVIRSISDKRALCTGLVVTRRNSAYVRNTGMHCCVRNTTLAARLLALR